MKDKHSENWGGARAGAGRKRLDKNGDRRTTRHFCITDAEAEKVKAFIKSLRDDQDIHIVESRPIEVSSREVINALIEKAMPQDDRFRIYSIDRTAYIRAPYHNKFIRLLKNQCKKAEWNDYEWIINKNEIPKVRDIMKEVYGRDDQRLYEEIIPVVKVCFTQRYMARNKAYFDIFDKIICTTSKYGRKMGREVEIVNGDLELEFINGDGDYFVAPAGMEVILFDTKKSLYDAYCEDVKKGEDVGFIAELVTGEEEIERYKNYRNEIELEHEKEWLSTRLELINAIIAIMPPKKFFCPNMEPKELD